MSGLADMDKIKAGLQQRFPGWQIWCVPPGMHKGGTWCAQPWPVINTGSPEELAAAIEAAHENPVLGSPSLASPGEYEARRKQVGEHDEAVRDA